MTAPDVKLLDAPPDIDAGPPMIHLAFPSTAHVALCGAPLRGRIHPENTAVDCVVCTDMWAAGYDAS